MFPCHASKPSLRKLFVNSNAGALADDDAEQLNFSEFLECLIRISLAFDFRGHR